MQACKGLQTAIKAIVLPLPPPHPTVPPLTLPAAPPAEPALSPPPPRSAWQQQQRPCAPPCWPLAYWCRLWCCRAATWPQSGPGCWLRLPLLPRHCLAALTAHLQGRNRGKCDEGPCRVLHVSPRVLLVAPGLKPAWLCLSSCIQKHRLPEMLALKMWVAQ